MTSGVACRSALNRFGEKKGDRQHNPNDRDQLQKPANDQFDHWI
jgi:hypothetical protein